MGTPRADRPYMPGYGIRAAGEGTGLLPWSWARERLEAARNYWVGSVRTDADGAWPHLAPVWGVWADDDTFWFSSGLRARKVRNLAAEPRCTVAPEHAEDPVVVEGLATIVTDHAALERFIAATNAKYGTGYGVDFPDPAVNATVQVRPERAWGLVQQDFTGSPTRWTFL